MESFKLLSPDSRIAPGLAGQPSSGRLSSARKPTYSDRFIPSRRGQSLQESFALLPDSQAKKRDAPQEGGKDDNLDTYTMLLRFELLGSEPPGGRRSDDVSSASPQRNLFRYCAMPSSRADENAAYALSPVGSDSQRVLCSPRKAPRKISTVPYKVLDAPALQDDFYLNLVDWSSLNVLAVGLGTCVYLWSACTSKVTKLCDLGPEDSVRACRTAITRRASHGITRRGHACLARTPLAARASAPDADVDAVRCAGDFGKLDTAGHPPRGGHLGRRGTDLGRCQVPDDTHNVWTPGARRHSLLERPHALKRLARPIDTAARRARRRAFYVQVIGPQAGGVWPQMVV